MSSSSGEANYFKEAKSWPKSSKENSISCGFFRLTNSQKDHLKFWVTSEYLDNSFKSFIAAQNLTSHLMLHKCNVGLLKKKY